MPRVAPVALPLSPRCSVVVVEASNKADKTDVEAVYVVPPLMVFFLMVLLLLALITLIPVVLLVSVLVSTVATLPLSWMPVAKPVTVLCPPTVPSPILLVPVNVGQADAIGRTGVAGDAVAGDLDVRVA